MRKTIDNFHQVSRSDLSLKKMFQTAKEDGDYKKVVLAIKEETRHEEIKKKKNSDHPGREYSSKDWSRLALLDDIEDTLLVYNSNRLVVPRSDRRRVLELLHVSHLQADTAINMARSRYFWPHMRQDVLNMINMQTRIF